MRPGHANLLRNRFLHHFAQTRLCLWRASTKMYAYPCRHASPNKWFLSDSECILTPCMDFVVLTRRERDEENREWWFGGSDQSSLATSLLLTTISFPSPYILAFPSTTCTFPAHISNLNLRFTANFFLYAPLTFHGHRQILKLPQDQGQFSCDGRTPTR
ncbi:hypothetical protein ARMGADRAFT_137596 [Armillaria gallica]|uniref:Uncharacterized protein n=1 Tax=Armillaria gallica TaxID=47427 RepID=A0A2H3DG55_ARMGA|nr:hypothetical protein ARMGADRAFT_137596 [Armillaria gallica]